MSLDYSNIAKYISSHRLQKYEFVCQNHQGKTLKLYQTNLRLSQAFYPILSLYEVILRNAINEELTAYFKDPNWLKNQVNGFMSDPTNSYYNKRMKKMVLNEFLKRSVQDAQKKAGYSMLQHKVVAELKLGYWTALFDPTNSKILLGRPMQIFSNLPSGTSRSNVFDKITRIRDFRNRVYHNEPIIFIKEVKTANPVFNLDKCEQVYKDLQDIFSWLGLDFLLWTKRINNVPFEIARARYMVNHYPAKIYYFKRIVLGSRHYYNKYLKYR